MEQIGGRSRPTNYNKATFFWVFRNVTTKLHSFETNFQLKQRWEERRAKNIHKILGTEGTNDCIEGKENKNSEMLEQIMMNYEPDDRFGSQRSPVLWLKCSRNYLCITHFPRCCFLSWTFNWKQNKLVLCLAVVCVRFCPFVLAYHLMHSHKMNCAQPE